jgi:hypothetical protein
MTRALGLDALCFHGKGRGKTFAFRRARARCRGPLSESGRAAAPASVAWHPLTSEGMRRPRDQEEPADHEVDRRREPSGDRRDGEAKRCQACGKDQAECHAFSWRVIPPAGRWRGEQQIRRRHSLKASGRQSQNAENRRGGEQVERTGCPEDQPDEEQTRKRATTRARGPLTPSSRAVSRIPDRCATCSGATERKRRSFPLFQRVHVEMGDAARRELVDTWSWPT